MLYTLFGAEILGKMMENPYFSRFQEKEKFRIRYHTHNLETSTQVFFYQIFRKKLTKKSLIRRETFGSNNHENEFFDTL